MFDNWQSFGMSLRPDKDDRSASSELMYSLWENLKNAV